jgi:hypothetical protein
MKQRSKDLEESPADVEEFEADQVTTGSQRHTPPVTLASAWLISVCSVVLGAGRGDPLGGGRRVPLLGYDQASLPDGYDRRHNRANLWNNAAPRMELCLAHAGGDVYPAGCASDRAGGHPSVAISILKPQCATINSSGDNCSPGVAAPACKSVGMFLLAMLFLVGARSIVSRFRRSRLKSDERQKTSPFLQSDIEAGEPTPAVEAWITPQGS